MMEWFRSSVVLTLLLTSAPAYAQQIRGRAVVEATRTPLAAATVRLVAAGGDTLLTTSTGRDGFFTARVAGAGTYLIIVEALGHASEQREVTVAGQDLLLPAFVLVSEAIPLRSIDVNARSKEREEASVGFARSSHVVAGSQLAHLERQSASVASVIRGLSNVRMRTIPRFKNRDQRVFRNYLCIEVVRRMLSIPDPGRPQPECEPVVFVLDGVVIGEPHDMLRSLRISDMERVEMLQPVDAGTRYGLDAGTYGALVIWTRGRGPHRTDGRNGG